jgi:hypothetical protein
MTAKINLDEKFGLFTDHWRPKIIAATNGQEVKIVKVQGAFPWHHHEGDDEFFTVWKGPVPGLIEPTGVVSTGDVIDAEFTAPTGVTI